MDSIESCTPEQSRGKGRTEQEEAEKKRERKKKIGSEMVNIVVLEQLHFFYLFVMIGKIMHQTIAGRVQRPYFGGVVIGTGR